MNHRDNSSMLQPVSSHSRKAYQMPAIIVELDLETRAGNSVFSNPACPDCPTGQNDNGQNLESFSSK